MKEAGPEVEGSSAGMEDRPARAPDPRDAGSVVKAVAWSAAHSWGSSFFAFLVTIVLARLLEPVDFGLVAMAMVYIHFVDIFVQQGLGEAVIQRSQIERAHLDSAFWISMGASVALAVASVAMARPIATIFREPDLAPVVAWLSLNLVFSGLQATQKAILKRELRFAELAVRALIANFVGGVAGVGGALAGLGVWSLVIQTLVGQAVSAALLWHISDWRPAWRVSMRHFRDLFRFGASVFASNIFTFANRHLDDLLIGVFLGSVPLGFYTIAYQIVSKATTLLVSVINRVAFPVFSRFQDDPVRMRDSFYAATRYTSLVAFPAFLGVFAVAPEFITVVYGAKWTTSIPVLQVLAFVGIFSAVFNFNGSVLLAAGKASWRLWLIAAYSVAAAVAFMVAVRWGIVAVAAGFVASRYLLSPLPVWMLHKVLSFRTRNYLRQFAVPLGGSALMVAGVLLLKPLIEPAVAPVVALVCYVLAGIVLYGAFVLAVSPGLPRRLARRVREARAAGPAGAAEDALP